MSDLTSPKGQEMLTLLPRYYETSRVMKSILQSQGLEQDELFKALDETLSQFFVDTSTWGLDTWEKELAIPNTAGKPDSQRRSVIKSKLRGIGTVTIALIKSVAEAYDGGTVEVTQQPTLYQFTVKFVDTLGVPHNLDDLKQAIDDVKPAHLTVVYQYKYLLIQDIHQVMTLADMETHLLTDFAPFIPV